ncbi:MAG: cytochrome b/b6 domain-containing protein [Fibrobacterales bacterium]
MQIKKLLHKLMLILVITGLGSVVVGEEFDVEEQSAVCAQCHEGQNSKAHVATQDIIDTTVHEGTYCLECHEDLKNEIYDTTAMTVHLNKVKPVQCATCHEDAAEMYTKHGIATPGTDSLVPSCVSCHGKHSILEVADTNSSVHEKNLAKTCGLCHENFDAMEKYGILNNTVVSKYQNSIHGMTPTNDSINPARCKDCHFTDGSAHKIYSPGNHDSKINHFIIPQTCGQCHEAEEKKYWSGIHGKLTARGETGAPVCTSCHGEHSILSTSNGKSFVSHENLAVATCTPCHNSAALSAKYGVDTDGDVSYIDDYHGSKSSLGDTTAANCASCHNAHDIRTQKDSLSNTNKANILKTCIQCHEDITQEIAETTQIHTLNRVDRISFWEHLFTILYIVIIVATIGGMIFYIVLDLVHAVRKSKREKQVKRMNGVERLQHMFLAISFTVLVFTGFALRFSDSWWADILFGRSGGFWIRHQIHIVSAVIIVVTCFWHLAYLKTKRGTAFIMSIFPRIKDAKDASQMIFYNLGLSKRKPEFDRFTFAEKFEYWALVWGMIVMTVTGFALWFDNVLVQYIPKEAINVMRIIHYYEAWLAALAILIWHMYGTVFNPHVYPMNPSWLTGNMLKKQYEHEHGADKDFEEVEENDT